MRLAGLAGLVAAVMAAASPARAESFISPFIGFNFGGDSANCASLQNCGDRRTNLGVSVGARHGLFGVEADLGYAPDFFGRTRGADNGVLTVMTSLMVVIPAGPIHPYGLIGVGLIRPHMQLDTASLAPGKNAIGYDIGGGVNLYLIHSLGIRGDVRRMRTLNGVSLGLLANEKLEFWRGSAGVTFRF
ncbi:MAG: outer membrane beta-barrel protein [Acidobacteria bacterium]|nr:outer membrane beta-barrel protein [Acidobacteriota bacterium]